MQAPAEPEAPVGDFEVLGLLNQGGEILRREIKNLLMESARGKLSAASARDLTAYIKLLNELKLEQQQALAAMDDEAVEAIASSSDS